MNITNIEGSISKTNEFMSVFRIILDNLFAKNDYTMDAKVILQTLKEKEIDSNKIKLFLNSLPEGQWNIKTFLNNIEKINELFGVSDETILECGLKKYTKTDLEKVKWQLLLESELDYSKFSNEFYDALKYNNSTNLSISKLKLLNEMMMTFKLIKEESKRLYNKYKDTTPSTKKLSNFNSVRIPSEFLILRILYIFMNLKDANEEKINQFAQLLAIERISVMYQKAPLTKFN